MGLDLLSLAGYTNYMTSKEIAIKIIQELPDYVTWSDIEERIRFLAAIDRGLADIKSGRIIPHKEVKESLAKWLSR
jgi:predicted transcriptional regulator